MDFRTQRRTLEVLSDLFQRKPQVGRVRFRPQRAGGRGVGYTGMPLPRSSPEREGLSSRQLLEFLRRAQVHPTINPHTLMVLCHGKVVCSCSFAPYREDVWHVTHSMCKSLTALAVGMLVGEGKLSLEEHICDIFPGRLSPLANPLAFRRMKAVTVRHLLTMSSGVNFNEAGAVTSEDWLGDFFSSGVGFEPGAKFAYNSMNSYVLSCIVRECSGMGLTEFLRPRLFAPLSMGRLHWEKSPQGMEKGGWGLYLFPEDMAKLGQLFLQEGVWGGRRLVPREFLEEMCSPQMATPPEMGEQGYGFQLWMGKRPGSYLCNGILGQNIIVLPDVDMVVVATGGNDCLFKTSTTISLVEEFFEGKEFQPGGALPSNRKAYGELKAFCAKARNLQSTFPSPQEAPGRQRQRFPFRSPERRLPLECRLLDGKEYCLEPEGARLLPLFTQLLQNNFTPGIRSLRFGLEDGQFTMTVGEGEEKSQLLLDFSGTGQPCEVAANGERYLAAASACFARDEDGNTVLKVLLPFLEQSSARVMKLFFFPGGKVELRLSEVPSFEAILQDTGLLENKAAAGWLSRMALRHDPTLAEYTVRRAVEPRARGSRREMPPGEEA